MDAARWMDTLAGSPGLPTVQPLSLAKGEEVTACAVCSVQVVAGQGKTHARP